MFRPNQSVLMQTPDDIDAQSKAYIQKILAEKYTIEETYMAEVSRMRHELKVKEKNLAEK